MTAYYMKPSIRIMFQTNKSQQRQFEGAGLKSWSLKKDMTLCVIHRLIQGSSSSTIIRAQGENAKLRPCYQKTLQEVLPPKYCIRVITCSSAFFHTALKNSVFFISLTFKKQHGTLHLVTLIEGNKENKLVSRREWWNPAKLRKKKAPRKGEWKKQRARNKVQASKKPKRGRQHRGPGTTKDWNLHRLHEAYPLKKGEISPIKLQA
jgi:hypothetical protein